MIKLFFQINCNFLICINNDINLPHKPFNIPFISTLCCRRLCMDSNIPPRYMNISCSTHIQEPPISITLVSIPSSLTNTEERLCADFIIVNNGIMGISRIYPTDYAKLWSFENSISKFIFITRYNIPFRTGFEYFCPFAPTRSWNIMYMYILCYLFPAYVWNYMQFYGYVFEVKRDYYYLSIHCFGCLYVGTPAWSLISLTPVSMQIEYYDKYLLWYTQKNITCFY